MADIFTKAETVTRWGRGQGKAKYPNDKGLQDAATIGVLEYALAMALDRLPAEEADAVVSFVYSEQRRAA